MATPIFAITPGVAELEAKLGLPTKTPDNSSTPPSKGQKPSAPVADTTGKTRKSQSGAHRPRHRERRGADYGIRLRGRQDDVVTSRRGGVKAAALAMLLPVAPRPAVEERLSSWLSRVAGIYGMSANALLAHFGLMGFSALTLEQGLSAEQAALIATRVGLSAQTIDAMTFTALAPHAGFLIAPSARYFCPSCAETPGVGRKDAVPPWTFWCSVHGARLWAREQLPMASFLPESVLARLDPLARLGGARLAAWAEDRDAMGETGAPTVPALLRFLTASYRLPSPPSLAEQPRLSLEARGANHAFLTRPIVRQALLFVAPEYDRVAPALAKPVRPGLAALARGSLLQNHVLAVGVARSTESLVEHAAATLPATDAEGEANLYAEF